ncbi:MAG: methylmalonyl Co-A mutase-associated GTPase MeaB [Candidatus Riflebacteria bacterium]|nr:methylmalonyl Co-A mutase-associated GTPase MeaB [Candidatus Riflebacteria bacterium]
MTPARSDDELLARFRNEDRSALARLLSLAENGRAADLLDRIDGLTGRAHVIGVTGSAGVGKSTLVDRLAAALRKRNRTVGVVCVDPSSPFTGGAVLGDRVRMSGLSVDPGIFIRSMSSRGAPGGLARTTGDLIRVLDAFGKGVVIVETVGVGQGEVEIAGMADTVVVLEVPGLGDFIQAIKAGILEIGDLFVVNKADRPGADEVRGHIEGMLEMSNDRSGWRPRVLTTVASQGQGIAELVDAIESHHEHLCRSGSLETRRRDRREAELRRIVQTEFLARLDGELARGGEFAGVVARVREGRLSPHRGAELLLGARRPGPDTAGSRAPT